MDRSARRGSPRRRNLQEFSRPADRRRLRLFRALGGQRDGTPPPAPCGLADPVASEEPTCERNHRQFSECAPITGIFDKRAQVSYILKFACRRRGELNGRRNTDKDQEKEEVRSEACATIKGTGSREP